MRTRNLSTYGLVTDRTHDNLKAAGWRPYRAAWGGLLWLDPRTGKGYTDSQAEAIRLDRLTPHYTFIPRY